MTRVAILFDNFGPYHRARLAAAAQVCELLALEVAHRSGDYSWEAEPAGGFHSECLFKGTSAELASSVIAARLNEVLEPFCPEVVVLPGWASRGALTSLRWCVAKGIPAVVMSDSQAIDEPRVWWKEGIKRKLVAGFSSGLVAGQSHRDYLTQLGMLRDRVFLGYDAVDNEYFGKNAERLIAEKLKSETG